MRGEASTYTFLFTDIEGSSRRWELGAPEMSNFIEAHNSIVRRAVGENGGRVFKSLGDGLAAVFTAPQKAVAAALTAQRELLAEERPALVRIGLNSGFAELIDGDYMGASVNRVARITDLGHGGQVLVSKTTFALAADNLPADVSSLSLGEYVLRGHARLEEVIQLHAKGMPSVFPPLRAAGALTLAPKHNLLELDRQFVGRRRERELLGGRLREGSQRLITVLGFGGMGKTTLANRCAWDCLGTFPDGVWWVDCETLDSRDQVVAAIASALDERIEAAEPEAGLAGAIGSRRMLLVLDCFEAVTSHAGALDRLLKRCSNLQMLVTSRVVLGLSLEYEFELRGLGEGTKRGGLNDGIELFAATAAQVDSGFALTRANRKLVSALVRSLECIPLAIILAAGRLRHLTLEEIVGRVQASVLDAVRSVSAPEGRHSNLRRVIEASFALMPEEDRQVAAELSVFDGGFFLSDALAVLQRGEDLTDAIGRIRDSSLLTSDRRSEGMRYRALDSVREYLGEVDVVEGLAERRLAHARHYLQTASQVRQAYDSGDWTQVSAKLSLEGGNLRRAARTAFGANEAVLVRHLAFDLCRPYLESGLTSDFEELASHALSLAAEDPFASHNDLAIELLGLRGVAARRAGNLALALKLWKERADVCEREGRFDLCGETYLDVLSLQLELGDADLAGSFAKFLAIQPLVEDEGIRAAGTVFQAKLALRDGQSERALGLAHEIERAWNLAEPTDDVFYLLRSLSELYRGSGHGEHAVRASVAMLRLALDAGFKHLVARALLELAHARLALNQPEMAAVPIAAAMNVPSSVSAAVVKEAKRLEEQLKGDELFDRALREGLTSPWLVLAREIALSEPLG